MFDEKCSNLMDISFQFDYIKVSRQTTTVKMTFYLAVYMLRRLKEYVCVNYYDISKRSPNSGGRQDMYVSTVMIFSA